jgi:hypothetical protein
MALGVALVSWLGACIPALLATVYDVSIPTPLTDVQALELPLAIAGLLIGFGLAALGGVLGGRLRRDVFRMPLPSQ